MAYSDGTDSPSTVYPPSRVRSASKERSVSPSDMSTPVPPNYFAGFVGQFDWPGHVSDQPQDCRTIHLPEMLIHGSSDVSMDDMAGDQLHVQPKRVKRDEKESGFCCPFRKRNPVKFNVRDHLNCAIQPFSHFSLLK